MFKFKFKMISIIVLTAFLNLEFAWGYPEVAQISGQNLSAQILNQEKMMTEAAAELRDSIVLEWKLGASILYIAETLYEDKLPLGRLAAVAGEELGESGSGIQFSHVAPKDGILPDNDGPVSPDKPILIWFKRDHNGKKEECVIQVALKNKVSEKDLIGYRWVLPGADDSDKYVFGVVPRGFSGGEKITESPAPQTGLKPVISKEPVGEISSDELQIIPEAKRPKKPVFIKAILRSTLHIASVLLLAAYIPLCLALPSCKSFSAGRESGHDTDTSAAIVREPGDQDNRAPGLVPTGPDGDGPPDIDSLIKIAGNKHNSDASREDAIRALGKIGTRRLAEFLVSLLEDRDVSIAASIALSYVGESALDLVIAIVEDKSESPQKREAAIATLGYMAEKALVDGDNALLEALKLKAFDLIIEALEDPEVDVQLRAARALAQLKDNRAIPFLIRIAENSDNPVAREYAIEALGDLAASDARDLLIRILRDRKGEHGFESLRMRAAEALGQIGGDGAFETLIDMLDDENEYVRWDAVSGLGKLKDKRAIPPLKALKDDKSKSVREAAREALAEIGGMEAFKALAEDLDSDDESTREIAKGALIGYMNMEAKVKLLDEAYKENDAEAIELIKKVLIKIDQEWILRRYERERGEKERPDTDEGPLPETETKDEEIVPSTQEMSPGETKSAKDQMPQAPASSPEETSWQKTILAIGLLITLLTGLSILLLNKLVFKKSVVVKKGPRRPGKPGNGRRDGFTRPMSLTFLTAALILAMSCVTWGAKPQKRIGVPPTVTQEEIKEPQEEGPLTIPQLTVEEEESQEEQASEIEPQEGPLVPAEGRAMVPREQESLAVQPDIQETVSSEGEVPQSKPVEKTYENLAWYMWAFAIGLLSLIVLIGGPLVYLANKTIISKSDKQKLQALRAKSQTSDTENRRGKSRRDGFTRPMVLSLFTALLIFVLSCMPTVKPAFTSVRATDQEIAQAGYTEKQLTKLLRHDDWQVRANAARALGMFGTQKALEPLIKALEEDSATGVQTRAARALGRISHRTGTTQAVPPLIETQGPSRDPYDSQADIDALEDINEPAVDFAVKALTHENVALRRKAAVVLGSIGNTQALDALIEAFGKENDADARFYMIYYLTNTRRPLTEPIKERIRSLLIRALEDTDGEVRAEAAKALREKLIPELLGSLKQSSHPGEIVTILIGIGRPGISVYIAALETNDPLICFYMNQVLAGIGKPAIPPLLEAIKRNWNTPKTRETIIQALAGIREGLAEALINALGSPDPGIRKSACFAMNRLYEVLRMGPPSFKRAVPLLAILLTISDDETKGYAIELLGKLQATGAIQSLIPLLNHADPAIIRRAAAALGRLHAEEAVLNLVAILPHSDPGVRARAAEALGKIKSPKAVEGLKRAIKKERIKGLREIMIKALASIGAPLIEQSAIVVERPKKEVPGDKPRSPWRDDVLRWALGALAFLSLLILAMTNRIKEEASNQEPGEADKNGNNLSSSKPEKTKSTAASEGEAKDLSAPLKKPTTDLSAPLFAVVENTLNNKRARMIHSGNVSSGELVIDSIKSNIILLARRQKDKSQGLVIALETGWIPGYDDEKSWQHKAMEGLIEALGKGEFQRELAAMGLKDRVKLVIRDKGDTGIEPWFNSIRAALSDKEDFSNVVVLGSQDVVNSFNARLTGENITKRPFLAGMDSKALLESYDAAKDKLELNQECLPIWFADILFIALNLAKLKEGESPDLSNLPMSVVYDQSTRMAVLHLPPMKAVDFMKFRQECESLRKALTSL